MSTVKEQKATSPVVEVQTASGTANAALIWFFVQGFSSISLTIFNKKLSQSYPYPAVIIAIQNLFTVPLFLVASYYRILPMNRIPLAHFFYSIPTTLCYVLLLWTSIEGLSVVSVALVVIMRNLVPLITGLIENIFFDLKLTTRSYLSLAAIFIGSVFYSMTDTTVSPAGLQWLFLNTAFSVLIPIVEKRYLVSKLKDQTPAGINFYRNVLSVPMLLCIAWLRGQLSDSVADYTVLDYFVHVMMLGSCITGFSIGLAYYFLLKLVSNTSIAIANTFYKLLTLAASFLFWGVQFHYSGSLGIILSFAGILSYTLEAQKKPHAITAVSPTAPLVPSPQDEEPSQDVVVEMENVESDQEKRH